MIYKIPQCSYTLIGALVIFLVFPKSLRSQGLEESSYGVLVLKDPAFYESTTQKNPLKKMIELKDLIPDLIYDLRYAGPNNFTKTTLYPTKTKHSFLRSAAAQALQKVQAELKQKGYGLKLFDAYRPYSVTVRFWELIKDDRYVAHPGKGSGHNRGLAIDLTIIKKATGKELNMGTGFDNFSDTAHQGFKDLPKDILENRALLTTVMIKHGFKPLETEWWHFYWPNDQSYEVLDIPNETIYKMNRKNRKIN